MISVILFSVIITINIILFVIICVHKKKKKIKIKVEKSDSINFSPNGNQMDNNKRSDEQIVINSYSNNSLVNEAKIESMRSSSQSTASKRLNVDSNETIPQMTDLRLKINDSLIRSHTNLIVSQQDLNDIYDVPPSRQSPNLVTAPVLVNYNNNNSNNSETNGDVVTLSEDDPNQIYDTPRR